MKEITLEVDEGKYKFFLDILRNFDFVSVKKDSTHKDIIMSVAKGMHQAKLASEGKMKSRSAKTFLNEI
ncbi:MAG: hypothetical protein WKF85_00595 [Chitinophagaceae bacterium]